MRHLYILLFLLVIKPGFGQITNTPPQFPGGDAALKRFIADNLQYPEQEKRTNTQGKVVVRFKVSETGEVTDVQVVKSLSPGLDAEAIRIIKLLPKFLPATENGVAVPYFYTIPITFTLSEITNQPTDTVYKLVENMPEFPGGVPALMAFLRENIKYPKYERDANIQGRVMVRFVVDVNGYVTDVWVTTSVSEGLDAEAVRVVKMLPRFKPGTQNGVPVPVYMNLPIVFKLKDNSTAEQANPIDTTQIPPVIFDGVDNKHATITQVEKTQEQEKGWRVNLRKNALKIDLLSPLSGSMLFLYERKIVKRFSVEIGVGPTFRNFLHTTYTRIFYPNDNLNINLVEWQGKPNTYDVNDNLLDFKYRTCTSGIELLVAPRIYVWGEGLNGLYIAPMVSYALTTYKYMLYNQQYQRDKNLLGTEIMNLIKPTLNLGYQFVVGDFCIETMLGGGVILERSKREDTGIDKSTDAYINGTRNINRILPEITTTLRIGYLFGAKYGSTSSELHQLLD